MKKNNMYFVYALVIATLLFLIGKIEISKLMITIPAVILAITIHEVGHAVVARYFGDKSQKDRITLNPFKHMDLIGFVMLLFTNIGWGKPVEVKRENLKSRIRNVEIIESIIALAGPAFNILAAVIFSFVYSFFVETGNIAQILMMIIYINVSVAIFNLIPLPPLDGYTIIKPILPRWIKSLVKANEIVVTLGVTIIIFMYSEVFYRGIVLPASLYILGLIFK